MFSPSFHQRTSNNDDVVGNNDVVRRDLEEVQRTPEQPVATIQSCNEASGEIVEPPFVGMVFDSWEAVEGHFKKYAKQQGFGIIKPGQGRRNNVIRNVTWRCECAGKPDMRCRNKGKKPVVDGEVSEVINIQPDAPAIRSKKVECKAMLYASVDEGGQWSVKKVILEHNGHNPTPRKSRYIYQHRKDLLTNHVKRKLFTQLDAGGSISQFRSTMALERNGLENVIVTDRDLRNVVAEEKKLKLKEGDANAMMKYFTKMQNDNPNFFHTIRLDEEERLQDVLWVDARSRAAFEEFGDVVCFDTTYLPNEYELPFANFVGVNHHGQTILLGCALVSRETTETFEWVFENWMTCMGNPLDAILTDQAPAIRAALENVMPDTRHRWCLWHIMQKFPGKLGGYLKYEEFNVKLRAAIYESLSPAEFEARWQEIVEEFKLHDNEWLSGLYEEKEMWVPAYSKDTFWAGMRSTQRVESIHSFFDGFFTKHTRLYEFVEQYCYAMETRVETEKEADAHTARCLRMLATDFVVEKVFQKVYTFTMFTLVQHECQDVMYCNGRQEKQISENKFEHVIEDRVRPQEKQKKGTKRRRSWGNNVPIRRLYRVLFDASTNEVSCECKLFESSGIMCRHSIRVMDLHDVRKVPEKYILRRWRKDIRRKHTMVKVAYHDPSKTVEVLRYDSMMLAFEKLASKAMESEEGVGVVMEGLSEMEGRLSEVGSKFTVSNTFTSLYNKGTPHNGSTGDVVGLGTPESVGTGKNISYNDPLKKKKGRGRGVSKRLSSPFQPGGTWVLKRGRKDKETTENAKDNGQKRKRRSRRSNVVGRSGNATDLSPHNHQVVGVEQGTDIDTTQRSLPYETPLTVPQQSIGYFTELLGACSSGRFANGYGFSMTQ